MPMILHRFLTINLITRLDFTNVLKPEDLFHNKVKIKVDLTIDDYRKKYAFKGNWYDKEYLYNYDKVFKAVLNLE